MTHLAPIADNLFATTARGAVRLLAGRHKETGQLVFPLPHGGAAFEPYTLRPDGTLWSYTIQRFRPKTPPYHGPAEFEPFAVGYVELDGELILESRLVGIPFKDLRVGLPVRLTTEAINLHGEGTPRLCFAFTGVREDDI
jgi:uncharacterized OB-fold protein